MLAEHTYCFIAHIKNLEKTCQQHMGMLRDFKLDMEVASLQILLNNVLGNVGSINCSHTVCINTQFAPPFFSIFKTYNFGFKFLLLPTSKPSESCDCPQIAWENANTELLGLRYDHLEVNLIFVIQTIVKIPRQSNRVSIDHVTWPSQDGKTWLQQLLTRAKRWPFQDHEDFPRTELETQPYRSK